MSATRILWGQIAFVLTIVLITTWAATQWTAWRLGYQPQLGHPWFELAPGIPIYLPPAFFWWWYAYDAYAPGVFIEGACVAAHVVISRMVKIQAIWPQSILVADMARESKCLLKPQTSDPADRECFRISRRENWCVSHRAP